MTLYVRFDFKNPIVVVSGVDEPTVLHGAYVGVQTSNDANLFNLYAMSHEGNLVGTVLGHMGCQVVENMEPGFQAGTASPSG
ncbi:hypothetical protein [Sphingomonas sp. CFBP 8760]|uniref:hypothetical protein n=1 Tax=Sphingomonas sp. CFBP 8760 TaxID=2775282 RepID=UPI00177A9BE8|nr:hypothetical protein [Sphingomonas sp. CFBP 8760]MBD8546845.1 hypothetical protein [Sphingomonas sp. CFBP 8760]